MKKSVFWFFVAMAFILQISFTSCKKEGIYRPDKKIAAIYDSAYAVIDGEIYTKILKNISEKWIWGEKDLDKIILYEKGKEYGTMTFSYEKKQLSEISINTDYRTYKAKFYYKKAKLSSIESFIGKKQVSFQEVLERENGKITKMSISVDESLYKNDPADLAVFKKQMAVISKFFFPEQVADQLSNMIENRDSKNLGSPIEITYTYSGDNVATMQSKDKIIRYQYDNKINPYYQNFKSFDDVDGVSAGSFSKNNVIEESSNHDYATYEYQYNNDWPIERKRKTNPTNIDVFDITYFEYK